MSIPEKPVTSIEVKYKRAGSGSIQFGDWLFVRSPEEFATQVLSVIDMLYGREDIFDLKIMTDKGKMLVNQDHGVPENIEAIIVAAFQGSVQV